MNIYSKRDPKKLEPYFSRHMNAMTNEGLEAKGDIAAELAHRDAELEYLRFFYEMADFGPAHEDVIYIINRRFAKNTQKNLPEGYENEH